DLLTDYQVAIIGVDDATYREWAEHGTLVTLDGKKITDARSLAGQIGLAKAMKKFDLHRVISFHSRVKSAKEFAASIPAVLDWMPHRQRPKGTLWSAYASGEMSAGERGVLIQHLKSLDDGERGLLSNARCLSEGVDVPALDGVAFIDPRRSEVDIVQAVGRAIRKSDTKTVGTIVIPVFIDTDEDAEVALDSSVFKPVWDVVRALRSHDTKLGEELDALRRELGRKGGKPRLPGKIHVDVPANVGKDFARAFEVRVVEKTTASWEFWFGLLQKYVAERGHSRVQRGEVFGGQFLDQWVNRQRTLFARGQLPIARSEKLEGLPGWTWDYRSDRWEEFFALVQDYVAANGHARIPRSHLSADNTKLGEWCKFQRFKYGSGDLEQDRASRLQALPGWSWDPNADRWEQGFEHLARFVSENGHARVPRDRHIANYHLGNWVAAQRTAFNNDELDPDRKRRLDAISGWVWDPFEEQWEANFQLLRDFVDEQGHSQVPSRYKVGGQGLGAWVKKQRTQHDEHQLDHEREVRFEALPGWTWDPHQDKWEEGFSKLSQYVESFGNARVPASYELDGYKLGRWVVKQRSNRTNDQIKPERQKRLEALPGWTWDRFSDQWEENFERLSRYVQSNGNANLSRSVKFEGFELGQWVNSLRSNRPDPEKCRRLESLPGWTWNSVADKWETGFSNLLRYVAAQGHSRVPKDFKLDTYPLGSWVANQRTAYARGDLDESRVSRLEGVEGWVWNSTIAGWEIAFQHLCDFVKQHGHARVSSKYKNDAFTLGSWVVKQRAKRQKLTLEQQQRLEALPGWDWNPPMGKIRFDS
ncbi:MAG: Helicase associated domain protein, partial [Actinomycetes bacterium]